MNEANFFNRPPRDERWEPRNRNKFGQESSFEGNFDPAVGNFYSPPIPSKFIPFPDGPFSNKYSDPVSIPNKNPLSHNPSLENKLFYQGEIFSNHTKNPNIFVNSPSNEADLRALRKPEDPQVYMKNDSYQGENFQNNNSLMRGRNAEQQQFEDNKKKMYNMDLRRQIEERENNKRNVKPSDTAEEYFPFGKPGGGAPYRDSSGRIIATRPPRYNENDSNYSKIQNRALQMPLRNSQDYEEIPHNQYLNSQIPPNSGQNRANNNPINNPYPPSNFQPNFSDKITKESLNDQQKAANFQKKTELQRALQEQIEEKQRKKDEEKRKKIMEERYEEERLKKERQIMEEEFKKEADKKKKQFNDLQAFNNNNGSINEPLRKGRRPRTPAEIPPPEAPQIKINEEPKPRGQSALARSPVLSQFSPVNQNPNEIPQEYINYLNSALEKKISELKSDYKLQEIKQQEEILKLKSKYQMNSEQNLEAHREIERLKEELRKKQSEAEIRHKELALALANTNNVGLVNNRVPNYDQRIYNNVKSRDETIFLADFASKSLVSESKFIPLPGPSEVFQSNLESPKGKIIFDSDYSKIPENYLNFETYKSGNSSIGIDNLNKRNEERMKDFEKFDPETRDELNKLDEILFKFTDNERNKEQQPEEFKIFETQARKLNTPIIYGKGENLPSIKEVDAEANYSLPEVENRVIYDFY